MLSQSARSQLGIGVALIGLAACWSPSVSGQARDPAPPGRPAPPRAAPAPQPEPPVVPEPPAAQRPARAAPAVRLQAQVYRVEVGKEHLSALDAAAAAVGAAAPGEQFAALEKLGSAELLYGLDQVFGADGRTAGFQVSRDTPYIAAGPGRTGSGESSPTVAREKVGAEFNVAGFMTAGDGVKALQLDLHIDLSFMTAGEVSTSAQAGAPVFWRISQNYSGTRQFGQPSVLVTLDGTPPISGNRALAVVTVVNCTAATP
jgi:hypothetical protein